MRASVTILQDLRYGWRMLAKHPGFTATAVAMLALGVGVNTTVFCWIQTIILNPLPGVADPGRLLAVVQSYRGEVRDSRLSYPDFQDIAALKDVFAGVIGTRDTPVVLEVNNQREWVYGRVGTANTFDLLGVKAELGRMFVPEDDQGEGSHSEIVISHGLWERAFGGDPAIVGKTVRVNQSLFAIVGVIPDEFRDVSGGSRADLWAPISMHDAILNYGSYGSRTFRWVQPLARLQPGVTAEQAQAALRNLSAQLEQSYPDSNKSVEFRAFPLWQSPYGGQAAFLPVLRILLAVGIGILLIVAVNVACLLLARASAREREVAIRLAMGAGRRRLMRQFLTESLLLALLGGALGCLFATLAVDLFTALAPAADARVHYDFHLDGQTLAFTIAITLATAVIFGLAPAVQASAGDFADSLREGGRGSGLGVRHQRLLNGLVVSEMALALLLLVGAGLCIEGFQRAKRIDLGFDPQKVIYANLNLVPNHYTAEKATTFDRELRQRLASLPGVEGAALVNTPPLGVGGVFTGTVDVKGHETTASEDRTVSFIIASAGYFPVMRIPILEGREFTDQDDATRSRVAMINENMAQRYWPGLDPLGRRFRMAVGIAPSDTFTVIGVVRNGKSDSLSEPPAPLVYVTYLQRPIASLFMNILLRTKGDPRSMIAAMEREVHALDPEVEPLRVVTLEEYIAPAFLPVRTATTLVAILGAVALLLSMLGIYGVMAYAVSRRTREIGIRMALGARPPDILRMVLRQGLILVGLGTAAGWFAALGLTRFLADFLYGVSASDPFVYGGAAFLSAVVMLAACYVPARRAATANPLAALHGE